MTMHMTTTNGWLWNDDWWLNDHFLLHNHDIFFSHDVLDVAETLPLGESTLDVLLNSTELSESLDKSVDSSHGHLYDVDQLRSEQGDELSEGNILDPEQVKLSLDVPIVDSVFFDVLLELLDSDVLLLLLIFENCDLDVELLDLDIQPTDDSILLADDSQLISVHDVEILVFLLPALGLLDANLPLRLLAVPVALDAIEHVGSTLHLADLVLHVARDAVLHVDDQHEFLPTPPQLLVRLRFR